MLEGEVKFAIPAHPGHYLAAASDDPKVQAKEEAQHKAKILKHDVWDGVVQFMKNFIIKAVNEECLANIKYEAMAFNQQKTHWNVEPPRENRGGVRLRWHQLN